MLLVLKVKSYPILSRIQNFRLYKKIIHIRQKKFYKFQIKGQRPNAALGIIRDVNYDYAYINFDCMIEVELSWNKFQVTPMFDAFDKNLKKSEA